MCSHTCMDHRFTLKAIYLGIQIVNHCNYGRGQCRHLSHTVGWHYPPGVVGGPWHLTRSPRYGTVNGAPSHEGRQNPEHIPSVFITALIHLISLTYPFNCPLVPLSLSSKSTVIFRVYIDITHSTRFPVRAPFFWRAPVINSQAQRRHQLLFD